MSASLVGSEMCIRDRAALTRCDDFQPRTRPEIQQREACVLSVPKRTKAVSYTHLTLPTICSV
eukprot:13922899-Alexandrium_andersonii.AAC.1